MENSEIKSTSPFSTETEDFYYLEAPGSPWPAAVGFPGLPGSENHQFLQWRDFLFHYYPPGERSMTEWFGAIKQEPSFFCLFFIIFSTGLVQLYITGLPLRFCWTIGAPSVQGSAQCPFS